MKKLLYRLKSLVLITFELIWSTYQTLLYIGVLLIGLHYCSSENPRNQSLKYDYDKGFHVGTCAATVTLTQNKPLVYSTELCTCIFNKLEQKYGLAVYKNPEVSSKQDFIDAVRSCTPKRKFGPPKVFF